MCHFLLMSECTRCMQTPCSMLLTVVYVLSMCSKQSIIERIYIAASYILHMRNVGIIHPVLCLLVAKPAHTSSKKGGVKMFCVDKPFTNTATW